VKGYTFIRLVSGLLYIAAVLTLVGGVWIGTEASSGKWVWFGGGLLGFLVYVALAQFISVVLDIEERTSQIAITLDHLMRQGSPTLPTATPPGQQPTSPGPGASRTVSTPARRAGIRQPFAEGKSATKAAIPSGPWNCPQCSTRNPSAVRFCSACAASRPLQN
jgi:hypothetical protein